MPGIRRIAVVVTALVVVSVAWATADPPQVLPAGTAVVFIADGHLDQTAREGTAIPIHLRDPLVLDGVVVAPAGTKADLLVGTAAGTAGRRTAAVLLERFSIPAGLMPIRARIPIVPPIAVGDPIDAVTMAEVVHVGDRYSIRVPFPFALPHEAPAAYYSPPPARTAPPHALQPPGRRRPTAAPSAPPTPMPDAASFAPSASAAPAATPSAPMQDAASFAPAAKPTPTSPSAAAPGATKSPR